MANTQGRTHWLDPDLAMARNCGKPPTRQRSTQSTPTRSGTRRASGADNTHHFASQHLAACSIWYTSLGTKVHFGKGITPRVRKHWCHQLAHSISTNTMGRKLSSLARALPMYIINRIAFLLDVQLPMPSGTRQCRRQRIDPSGQHLKSWLLFGHTVPLPQRVGNSGPHLATWRTRTTKNDLTRRRQMFPKKHFFCHNVRFHVVIHVLSHQAIHLYRLVIQYTTSLPLARKHFATFHRVFSV